MPEKLRIKVFDFQSPSPVILSDDLYMLLHSYSQNVINFYYENVALQPSEAEELCFATQYQGSPLWLKERKVSAMAEYFLIAAFQ